MKSTDHLRHVQDEIAHTAFSRNDYLNKSDFFRRVALLPSLSNEARVHAVGRCAMYAALAAKVGI